MADIGRIWREELPNGRIRFRLDFGRHRRKRLVVGHWKGLRFDSEASARRALDLYRADFVQSGKPLHEAVVEWNGISLESERIGTRIESHVEHFRGLVAAGKRSPTTLRELERYSKTEGHIGAFWGNVSIMGLTYGQIEDWHTWLAGRCKIGKNGQPTGEAISLKSQKNVSDAFRAFLRWSKRRDPSVTVPDFPSITVPRYVPKIVDVDQTWAVVDAIPWERRGFFLAAASEGLRLSEIRPIRITDFGEPNRLRITRAKQGARLDAPEPEITKNNAGEVRTLWHPELVEWIRWRLERVTDEERLAGAALFWNPTARNARKQWTPDPAEREWRRACTQVGVDVPFQQGTRHAILTKLGETLPDHALRAFSRHKDVKSVQHYAKPRPRKGAIVAALRPNQDES